MNNSGKEYEMFVANIQSAILLSETQGQYRNIVVELDKKIVDRCGISRQFDVYWEYEFGGHIFKTVIECKDYKSKISVDKVDALIGKISDFHDLKGVFASRNGYQSGALAKAEANKIDLLIVREQRDSDWKSQDGAAYIT